MITISRDGQQFGPYSPEDAKAMVHAGQLTRNDLAWTEGAADWRPLGEILGLPAAPPALPPAANGDAERVIFQERNISVSNKQIIIDGQIFVVKNIGGVTIQVDPAKYGGGVTLLLIATFGFIFGMPMFLVDASAGVVIYIIALVIGVIGVCSLRNARATYYIGLTAAGGLTRAYGSKDKAFVERVVHAIQEAII